MYECVPVKILDQSDSNVIIVHDCVSLMAMVAIYYWIESREILNGVIREVKLRKNMLHGSEIRNEYVVEYTFLKRGSTYIVKI